MAVTLQKSMFLEERKRAKILIYGLYGCNKTIPTPVNRHPAKLIAFVTQLKTAAWRFQDALMNNTLYLVLYMGIVTWITLISASIIRARTWETGPKVGLGNRDNLPEPTPLSGRAARTAQNTLENFIFFAIISLIAQAMDILNPRLLLGAQIFFWSRIIYIPVYYAGVIYLRTAVWIVSLLGLAMMLSAIF